MKVSTILRDTIQIKELIDHLGIDLKLDKRSGGFKYVGNCITGHASESETCFHVFNSGYYCHSCGAKGNIFDILKESKGLEFKDAFNYLIDNFRPDLRNKRNGETKNNKTNSETYLKAALYEELYKYGKELLYSDTGAEALVYLINDRNYEEKNLKQTEWFYLQPEKDARAFLLKKFPDANEQTKKFIKGEWKNGKFNGLSLSGFYGDNFRLAFPYRDRSGAITGFLKRATTSKGVAVKKKDKVFDNVRYDSSIGLSKKDLFNLWRYSNAKEVLLVEGYPDALYFHTLGINTVAVGQGALSATHIEGLKVKGIKRVIISLDNDGKDKGEKHTKAAIKLLLANDITPFVIPPQSLGNYGTYKDLDELLRGKGEEILNTVITKEPLPHYLFNLNEILDKYVVIEKARGQLTYLDIDNFLEEVVALGITLKPLEKGLFINSFLKLKGIKSFGITTDSLDATLEDLQFKRDKEQQNKGLTELLKKTQEKQNDGKVGEALVLLSKQSKQLINQDKKSEYEKLLVPIQETEFKAKLREKPESLATNYEIGNTEILLPSGAISYLVAPTSHGKTTFLINLIINVARLYPKKQFHLFSYEEDRESIIANCLNVFIGETVAENNRAAIKHFYTNNSEQHFSKATALIFREKKREFFEEFILTKRINIHYINYSSEMLGGAIDYLRKNSNVGAVFIDYMQLLKKEEGNYNSRQGEIKQICLELKDTAVETGLPLVLGAQFNREVINHLTIHATNIGEAGDIERIANLIIGFWDNRFTALASKNDANYIEGKGWDKEGTIYAKVLKNRGGAVGDSGSLNYNSNTGKISNDTSIIEDF